MKTFRGFPVVFCVLAATAALAHQGVQNPTVKARMDSMEVIGQSTKILGQMAKGVTAFDAETVRRAAGEIAREAKRTPALFAAREYDPLSEASQQIWANFEDFSVKSEALRLAAEQARTVGSLDELRPALAGIGQACKACHGDYRE